MWLTGFKLLGLSIGALLGLWWCFLRDITGTWMKGWWWFCGDKAGSLKYVCFNVNITTFIPKFTDVSKRHVNEDLYSIQNLWYNICTLLQHLWILFILVGIEVDNITGVTGDLMVKSLHTNYSKKQNSKFPQSVFEIYNHLLSLVSFIIYWWQGDGRCIQNVVRKPKEKLSVQRLRHGWYYNIKMDINLIFL